MPFTSNNQGINVSSGIGAGEAQVFTPYTQAPSFTAKDYIDLYDKKRKEDEAKAAAIAAAKIVSEKAKADSLEKAQKRILELKDKPLLPDYQVAVQKIINDLYDVKFKEIYSNPLLSDQEKQMALSKEVDLISQKITDYATATADYKAIQDKDFGAKSSDDKSAHGFNDKWGTITGEDIDKVHKEIVSHNANFGVNSVVTTTKFLKDYDNQLYHLQTEIQDIQNGSSNTIGNVNGKKSTSSNVRERQVVTVKKVIEEGKASALAQIGAFGFDTTVNGELYVIPLGSQLIGSDLHAQVKLENPELFKSILEVDANGTPSGYNKAAVQLYKDAIQKKADALIKDHQIKSEQLNKSNVTNITNPAPQVNVKLNNNVNSGSGSGGGSETKTQDLDVAAVQGVVPVGTQGGTQGATIIPAGSISKYNPEAVQTINGISTSLIRFSNDTDRTNAIKNKVNSVSFTPNSFFIGSNNEKEAGITSDNAIIEKISMDLKKANIPITRESIIGYLKSSPSLFKVHGTIDISVNKTDNDGKNIGTEKQTADAYMNIDRAYKNVSKQGTKGGKIKYENEIEKIKNALAQEWTNENIDKILNAKGSTSTPTPLGGVDYNILLPKR